jgi:ribosomal protein S21
METRKKEKESVAGLLYRFNLKMKQSGILREVKKRRFHQRPVNRRKKRISAIYREAKKKEMEKARKLGEI